jgi:hypothetical protein
VSQRGHQCRWPGSVARASAADILVLLGIPYSYTHGA